MKYRLIIILVLLISMLFAACNEEGNEPDISIEPVISKSPSPAPSSPSPTMPDEIETKVIFSYVKYIPEQDFEPCFSIDNSLAENILRYEAVLNNISYYGYMDLEFNVLSLPISRTPYPFSNGLALIEDSGGSYVIDKNMQSTGIEPWKPFKYKDNWYRTVQLDSTPKSRIKDKGYYTVIFDNDKFKNIDVDAYLVPVRLKVGDGLWGYKTFYDTYIEPLSMEEGFAVSPIYSEVREFSEGLAAVKKDGKWGYIDESGNTVIEFRYDIARDFENGLASVAELIENESSLTGKESKWGVIDSQGSLVVDGIYGAEIKYEYGLDVVRLESGYNIIDIKGELLLPQSYMFIYLFDNGRVLIFDGEKYFYTDYLGQNINGELYGLARAFSENLAAVQTGQGWGYISSDGVLVVESKYRSAYEFHDGYALVSDRNNSFLIDRHGTEYLKELKLSNISEFNKDGYALAYSEDIKDEESERIYYIIHKENLSN